MEQPFFVLEFVDGLPIDEYADTNASRLTSASPSSSRCARRSATRTAGSVVHRDLKPSNMLVTHDGQVKLLDFGIAKVVREDDEETLTRPGATLMSPAYASPEQVRGEPVGTATDIYSLGVVLYQLLTGKRPYTVVERQSRRGGADRDRDRADPAVARDRRHRHTATIAAFGISWPATSM